MQSAGRGSSGGIPTGVSPVGWIVGWIIWLDIWLAVAASGIYFYESRFNIMSTLLHFFLFLVFPVYSISMYIAVYIYQLIVCPVFGFSQAMVNEVIDALNWTTGVYDEVKNELSYFGQFTKIIINPKSAIKGYYEWKYGAPQGGGKPTGKIQKLKMIPPLCPGSETCRNAAPLDNIWSPTYYGCPEEKKQSNKTLQVDCLTPAVSQFNTQSGGIQPY